MQETNGPRSAERETGQADRCRRARPSRRRPLPENGPDGRRLFSSGTPETAISAAGGPGQSCGTGADPRYRPRRDILLDNTRRFAEELPAKQCAVVGRARHGQVQPGQGGTCSRFNAHSLRTRNEPHRFQDFPFEIHRRRKHSIHCRPLRFSILKGLGPSGFILFCDDLFPSTRTEHVLQIAGKAGWEGGGRSGGARQMSLGVATGLPTARTPSFPAGT